MLFRNNLWILQKATREWKAAAIPGHKLHGTIGGISGMGWPASEIRVSPEFSSVVSGRGEWGENGNSPPSGSFEMPPLLKRPAGWGKGSPVLPNLGAGRNHLRGVLSGKGKSHALFWGRGDLQQN